MKAASISSASFTIPVSNKITRLSNSKVNFCCIRRRCDSRIDTNRTGVAPIKAINDISNAADPARVEVTWQIIVGSIAGVTPFVVAGIEFSKRIEDFCHGSPGNGSSLANFFFFKFSVSYCPIHQSILSFCTINCTYDLSSSKLDRPPIRADSTTNTNKLICVSI
ncbi:uncharacterized protein LOC123201541 isoform X1 [Mangifera indica]|uniref:uncharacterized protein LOC123201541 isoform X1 n=1 Tax=Mangifera indica TaxID=29780 RepID=UPI001CF9A5D6|nr:uncharacterized protein LOC123201541 isoform X1 [Mangifera indica]